MELFLIVLLIENNPKFPLNGVIPGWQEALQMMSVANGKFSSHLNLLKERGVGTIGPNSTSFG